MFSIPWIKRSFNSRSGPEFIKKYHAPQLSTKLILLINVKMPTIVGILTFISMINTTSERLKERNFFICQYFSFYEQLKRCAQLIWAWTSFITSGPGPPLFPELNIFMVLTISLSDISTSNSANMICISDLRKRSLKCKMSSSTR